MIDLTVVWAAIIAFAIAAYVVMDGFELGLGAALAFGAHDHAETFGADLVADFS